MYLTGEALRALFPGAAITQPLDSVLRELDFIGASNFWHTLRVALNGEAFDVSTFQKIMVINRLLTHEELRSQVEGELDGMNDDERKFMLAIYDKSVFTAQWTLRVLRQAFGVPLTEKSGDGGKEMTFTPYNGSGDDNNRFSWTLGTAVLLASTDPKELEVAVAATRVPAEEEEE